MKSSIVTLVALVATLGMLQWMRRETARTGQHQDSCADVATTPAPSTEVAFIGICRN
jgi:hypothetical protein